MVLILDPGKHRIERNDFCKPRQTEQRGVREMKPIEWVRARRAMQITGVCSKTLSRWRQAGLVEAQLAPSGRHSCYETNTYYLYRLTDLERIVQERGRRTRDR